MLIRENLNICEQIFFLFFQVPLVLTTSGLLRAQNGLWIQIEER